MRIAADAWWQIRILDLDACLAAMRPAAAGRVRFVLELDDPVTEYLEPPDGGWGGIGGRWRVDLGTGGVRVQPADAGGGDHPVLSTSVGSLSRWWLGVLPASSLAVTGEMMGPDHLLADLDALTADLPRPQTGWDF